MTLDQAATLRFEAWRFFKNICPLLLQAIHRDEEGNPQFLLWIDHEHAEKAKLLPKLFRSEVPVSFELRRFDERKHTWRLA